MPNQPQNVGTEYTRTDLIPNPHAVALAAMEKAERAARSYGDNSYAAQMIGDAISALMDPAALAEIVKGNPNDHT